MPLKRQYPVTDDRIRALTAWFGSGSGPWSGFPGYEEIAARLLRQYPTPELIKAVDGRPLTDQEVEGAARILGSWTPASDLTPISVDLRRILLEDCLKSPDQDKVERAKSVLTQQVASGGSVVVHEMLLSDCAQNPSMREMGILQQ